MKTRNCLSFVTALLLTAHCASARAQDRQPPAPAPEAEQRMRAIEERIRDTEARLTQMRTVAQKTDENPELRALMADLERLRKERDEFAAQRGPDRREPGSLGFPNHPAPRAPGAPPSVEQRLEQLERAVREMHALFERHGVPGDARERAEREMRERGRQDDRPQPGGRAPEPMDRPARGERPPEPSDRPPQSAPLPPRPQMPRFEFDAQDRAKIEEMLTRQRAEAQAAQTQAAEQVAAMRRQLEDARAALASTQEALKKAQAELDALRKK